MFPLKPQTLELCNQSYIEIDSPELNKILKIFTMLIKIKFGVDSRSTTYSVHARSLIKMIQIHVTCVPLLFITLPDKRKKEERKRLKWKVPLCAMIGKAVTPIWVQNKSPALITPSYSTHE